MTSSSTAKVKPPVATPFEHRPRILCVHPNTELYGSDRVFLSSVKALREKFPDAWIAAVLTGEGPITASLSTLVDEILIEKIFVLRKGLLGLRMLAALPRLALQILRARSLMNRFDVAYINTVVMPDYLFASRLRRKPALVHIHELPVGLARKVFSGLLLASNAHLIFISDAVRRGYDWVGKRPHSVIWNGVPQTSAAPRTAHEGLRLLLIGRFNGWKGQPLLLEALAGLRPDERAQIEVRLLGSAYAGREHFEVAIHEQIARDNLGDTVRVVPFDPDPAAHYAWADAVIVPSTEPEPFGLVAIEAMGAGRSVIAAGHGGLDEIVVDGVTGRKIRPGDAADLRAAIRFYLEDPSALDRHGSAGHKRFLAEFDEAIYARRLAQMVGAYLSSDHYVMAPDHPLEDLVTRE